MCQPNRRESTAEECNSVLKQLLEQPLKEADEGNFLLANSGEKSSRKTTIFE
jgi:hypothetical protein